MNRKELERFLTNRTLKVLNLNALFKGDLFYIWIEPEQGSEKLCTDIFNGFHNEMTVIGELDL